MSCKTKLAVLLLASSIVLPHSAFAADAEKGKEKFATLCAMCHGATGKGDGAAASAFPADQKPRDLSSGEMKYATDEAKFKELLHKGGGGVGLSALMPPQAGLSDEDIANLWAYVQSLKQ